MHYIVVSPVRDETKYIEKTISSMISQKTLPKEWIIVDDGSMDNTAELVEKHAARHSWIKVVHRRNRGFRKPGGGVIEAFNDGYSSIGTTSWDFIVKLDGDLCFDQYYFEKCFERFAQDPDLGIGGAVYVYKDGHLALEYEGDPAFHVRGATKIYRRSCWEKIAPLIESPG